MIPADLAPLPWLQLCYNSVEACSQGPNSCNTTYNPNLCEPQLGICSTGQAAGTGLATVALHDSGATTGVVGYNFFCLSDLPVGSLPAGSGAVCYQSHDQCMYGPNGCNATVPCQQNFQECPTGIAGSAGFDAVGVVLSIGVCRPVTSVNETLSASALLAALSSSPALINATIGNIYFQVPLFFPVQLKRAC